MNGEGRTPSWLLFKTKEKVVVEPVQMIEGNPYLVVVQGGAAVQIESSRLKPPIQIESSSREKPKFR